MKFRDVLYFFIAIGGWIIILITVIWAYFHDFWYAFNINLHGEAWLDMSLIVGFIIFLVYWFIIKIKKI